MPLSPEFVLFCAAAISLHWLLPGRLQGAALLLWSALFFGYWDLPSLALLVAAAMATYALSGPAPLAIVALALLLLGLRAGGWVFLGAGFYTLKLIHYAVERRAGTFPPHGLLAFLRYLLFFPALAVGPIHRFEDFLRDERRRRWDGALFAAGIERVIHGYAKVVVLADFGVARHLSPLLAAALPPASGRAAFGRCLVHGLSLYLTFAGASDIAIGLGRTLGYRLPENFSHPFLRANLGEFWQSWHMSLSAWCRRYVFLPAAARWRSPALAVLLSMLTIAAWHELSARYLLWALYHSIGILAWHLWRRGAARLQLPAASGVAGAALRGLSVALTFTFVIAGFAITRHERVADIAAEYRRMVPGPAAGGTPP